MRACIVEYNWDCKRVPEVQAKKFAKGDEAMLLPNFEVSCLPKLCVLIGIRLICPQKPVERENRVEAGWGAEKLKLR